MSLKFESVQRRQGNESFFAVLAGQGRMVFEPSWLKAGRLEWQCLGASDQRHPPRDRKYPRTLKEGAQMLKRARKLRNGR